MRWYLRKTQGSLNIPEYSDSQEPRRSILRSRTQNKEPCAEHDIGEASMVDLRSSVAGPRNSGVAKVNARLVANASVRSMDVSNRRNVLFLDEVQRSRKPCNYNHVFEDASPGTSSFTPQPSLASYPTSYQASPVLSRRDDESDEIELVSRSPLPPTKPDEDSAVWVGTPIKQAFMNLSLSKRKRAKRERSLERQSIPMENGNINTAPMLDSVNNYPNVVQSVPGKQQARTKESNFLLRSSVTINSREINFKTIQPPTTSPPMVRRPMFPRVIEAAVPQRTGDIIKGQNVTVEWLNNSVQPIPNGRSDETPTGNTDTLKARNPLRSDTPLQLVDYNAMKPPIGADIIRYRSKFLSSSVVRSDTAAAPTRSAISSRQEHKRPNTPNVRIVYLTESHDAKKELDRSNKRIQL